MAQYRYTREWDEFQFGSGQLARKMRIIVPPERPLTEPEGTGVSETRTYSLQTLIMPSLSARPAGSRRSKPRKVILHDLGAVEQVLDFVQRKGGKDPHLDIAGTAFVVRWRDGG